MLNSRGVIRGVIIAMAFQIINAKVFDKCELALELRDKNLVPTEQIGAFVCIAERLSNYNTEVVGSGTYYGMFQISSDFWCQENYPGKACGVQCASLTDDDITDDLSCVQIIFDEHQRLFNNGFNAWPSAQYCQSQADSFVQECYIEDNQIIKTFESVSLRHEKLSGSVSKVTSEGKVYGRCELARELYYQHKMPIEQIPTWVCIVKHESAFNTSAVGRLNWDGSEDHGLFQISDIYWCGANGKSCGAQCSEFRNDDISDDVKCVKKIHAEHQRLSGDGFNAWTVYPRCKDQSSQYTQGCFDDSENEIMPVTPRPGIVQPTKTYAQATHHRKSYDKSVAKGKVYERCELAQELRFKHKIPLEQVATWVCIAKHESSFNTSAVGRLNTDGSEDHGLFQISDIYWCSPPGTGTVCGVACSKFEDSDISDDVECMMKIYDEHQSLSGDGFNAWTVYNPHCRGRSTSYIDGCFGQNNNNGFPRPAITQPSRQTTTSRVSYTKPATTVYVKPATTSYSQPASTAYTKPVTTAYTHPATTTRTFTQPLTTAVNIIRKVTSQPPTTRKATTTFRRKSTYQPVTTVDTTLIDTTIKASTVKSSSVKPSTARSTIEKSTATVKAFNSFDNFFNSIKTGPANNAIKPVVLKASPSKTAPKTAPKPVKQATSSSAVKSQATSRTTSGNPSSKSVNLKSTSASTGKTTLTNKRAQTTTARIATQKITRQSVDSQSKRPRETPPTKIKAATLKPFNVFDFYLNGYTSKAPIIYRPVQFSDRSTVIIKKPENYDKTTRSPAGIKTNAATTTRRPLSQPPTVKPLSIYNAFEDYSVRSNRIGRVVKNITPYSFDKLLKLTTPRPAFKRS